MKIMKKLFVASFLFLCASTLFAQTGNVHATQIPVPKTPGIAATAKAPAPVAKAPAHTMVKTTAAHQPVAASSTKIVTAPATIKTSVVLKKDGTPDNGTIAPGQ